MSHNRQRKTDRRGMSIVVVMCLIAITLGTSYALMRVEYTGARIQKNSNRQSLARHAAMVGISVALRKMQEDGWGGVGTSISGNSSPQESYQVSYTAGDASLTSSSPSYSDYPYRVTLDSTGYSTDSSTSGLRGTYRIKVVVRLIPRKLADGPPELEAMSTHPVYQTNPDTFQIQVPIRIEGPTRIQGAFTWPAPSTNTNKWSNAQRDRYLDDLDLMRLAGQPDQRPFEGPIYLDFSQTSALDRGNLTDKVGVSLVDTPTTGPSSQWTFPSTLANYRIYPGGPLYSVGSLPSTVNSSTALGADPLTNPAGIFARSGSVDIVSGANVQGTLITTNKMDIETGFCTLAPVPLPAVYGSATVTSLPTVIVSTDLELTDFAIPTIHGLVAVFNEFRLPRRYQAVPATFRGCLAAKKYRMEDARVEWSGTSLFWNPRYNAFLTQLSSPPPTRIDFFPQYLQAAAGLLSDPQVKFLRSNTPISYVWPTNGGAIFAPHPSDGGLRWELISWRDNQ